MLPVALATLVIFLVFHLSADWLRSTRGEWGILIALMIVAAVLLAEGAIFGRTGAEAVRAVGLRAAMTPRAVAVALAVSLVLVGLLPIILAASDAPLQMQDGWLLMLPGLFCQAGIAEETLFRGFLFGSVRERSSFWRAAFMSSGPFVLAHVPLFATMEWTIALASLLLALVISFPLAHLYELGNRSIWAPAVLHTTIQGAVKVVDLDAAPLAVPLLWMAVCAVIPWGVFLVRTERR
jgi:membrane protease YdiL (CAAX protease family)